MSEQIKVFKVVSKACPEKPGYGRTINDLEYIIECMVTDMEAEYWDIGEQMTISVERMSRSEYEALEPYEDVM